MKVDLFLGLGSNMGDRKALLDSSIERLSERLEAPVKAVSDYIQTSSWGFDGADFLNAVVVFEIEMDAQLEEEQALQILDICKEIERELGRTGAPEWDENGNRIYRDRPVDIDILKIGDLQISHPRLVVPHPLAAVRDFVTIPMKQIEEKLQIINNQ